MPLPPHHRQSVGLPVVDDWAHLVRIHQRDLEGLLVAAGYRPRSDPATAGDPVAADECLAELVRSAATDPLAARIVLQRLLPGLLAIARRRGHGGWTRTHLAFDELLAASWVVIRRFPIDRRPHRVAAHLLQDIEYQAFTRPARLRRVVAEPTAPADLDRPVEGRHGCSPFEEVVEVLLDGRQAGLAPDDLRLAADLASGRPLAECAAERGVRERTERYRRARVAARLRAATTGEAGDVQA